MMATSTSHSRSTSSRTSSPLLYTCSNDSTTISGTVLAAESATTVTAVIADSCCHSYNHDLNNESKQAEFDAAQALLGVSPAMTAAATMEEEDGDTTTPMEEEEEERNQNVFPWEESLVRMRYDASLTTSSTTLDALEMLASNAAVLLEENHHLEEEDGSTKIRGRMRSISNPEGMEKWDSLRRAAFTSARHFVQPTIMEEEDTTLEKSGKNFNMESTITPVESNHVLVNCPMNDEENPIRHRKNINSDNDSSVLSIEQVKKLSESDVQEMLLKARAKLLDDGIIAAERSFSGAPANSIAAASATGLVLPHALDKYREVYNKHGRIGIYTPSERAAIISRFNSKRARRVWNKKIRYSCRKSLADRRLRIKGRFVKRSADADVACYDNDDIVDEEVQTATNACVEEEEEVANNYDDEDRNANPDLDDTEAGFIPTSSQPYRRIRRHTIT